MGIRPHTVIFLLPACSYSPPPAVSLNHYTPETPAPISFPEPPSCLLPGMFLLPSPLGWLLHLHVPSSQRSFLTKQTTSSTPRYCHFPCGTHHIWRGFFAYVCVCFQSVPMRMSALLKRRAHFLVHNCIFPGAERRLHSRCVHWLSERVNECVFTTVRERGA